MTKRSKRYFRRKKWRKLPLRKQFSFINPEYAELLGYSVEDVLKVNEMHANKVTL